MSKYIVRPSAASQRLNCPGSLILEREAPPEAESSYASEGTLAHGYGSQVLEAYYEGANRRIAKIIDNIPSEYEGADITDMPGHVSNYLNLVKAVEARVEGFDQVWIEKQVKFNVYMGGTSDFSATYEDKSKLFILDLKYGQGVSVYAEDNMQLTAYVLSVIRSNKLTDIKTVTMIIYQPRARDGAGSVRHWTIDAEKVALEMDRFEKGVEICRQVYYKEIEPMYKAGDHCLWCRAKPFCKAFKDHIAEQGIIALDSHDNNLPSPDKLTKEQIAGAMAVKGRIMEFYRAVEPYVIDQIEKGEKFPGVKVIAGKTNRRWLGETDAVARELRSMGVEEPVKITEKLIGIGAVEKIIGKRKLGNLTVKPPGKPKLVREEDARAEIHLDNPLDMLDTIEVEE